MEFFSSTKLDEQTKDVWEVAQAAAMQVAQVLKDKEGQKKMEMVKKAVNICKAHGELKKMKTDVAMGNSESLLKAVVSLQRHLLGLDFDSDELKGNPAMSSLKWWATDAKKLVEEVKGELTKFSEQALDSQLEMLRPAAGGMDGEGSWPDDCSGTASLEDLLAKASSTLFLVDVKKMENLISGVNKAGHGMEMDRTRTQNVARQVSANHHSFLS